MSIISGNWENWRIKTKNSKGEIISKPTMVYVVRRGKGRLVSWTKQENLDRLNQLIYQYAEDTQELPEGLYYEYHMNTDITPNPQMKEDYDDIISIRFSSKTKIPANRFMGRVVQEINRLSSPEKDGPKRLLQQFNWTSLKSKNNFTLLKDINMGITTRPVRTEVKFKGRTIR
jgi:hypothetical protein